MSKSKVINESMLKHLFQVEYALNMADIVADDFEGVECSDETFELIQEIKQKISSIHEKLIATKVKNCSVCGKTVNLSSSHVKNSDGTVYHLGCWEKADC